MLARVLGGLFIAAAMYLCAASLAFAVALYLLVEERMPTGLPWLSSIQRSLYHGGLWQVWQNQPQCVEFDERLVYRAKDGACHFANVEFDTVLNFRGGRRLHRPLPGPASAPAIAVLGDSHAMGWGVHDHATFAARLQQRLARPVHNLGVSSYGTARELEALRASGLAREVDTVVIQYSENDVEENRRWTPPSRADAERAFAVITARPAPPSTAERLRALWPSLKHALNFPMIALRRELRGPPSFDFAGHLEPLRARLEAAAELRGKRVIVFYSNTGGARFRGYPSGRDPKLPEVTFVDLALEPSLYFPIDGHLTEEGHLAVAERLARLLAER